MKNDITMKRYVWPVVIILILLLTFSGCVSPNSPAKPIPTPTPSAGSAPEVISVPYSDSALSEIEVALENIYAQVNPSVVNIRVVQKEEVIFPTFPEIPGFPFFGSPAPQEPQEQYRSGLGSGFVWDIDGHIVTNNHVVDGADRISVTFPDGTTVPGKVVGTDPDSDLAVIQVDVPPEQLQPVQMADSTQVKVGQMAIAIGNPFGLEGTMTVGFVSALERLLPTDAEGSGGSSYSIPDIIQTDAPINPGNSGGVLVDHEGDVIGVTSAIISPVQASAGIGFAIPSAIVKKVVPILIKTGHYEHPWLGVSGVSLNPDLTKAIRLNLGQRGVLVVDVVPDSPADKAGLRGSDIQVTIDGEAARVGGDIIIAIDAQTVSGFDDLVTYLARSAEAGQTVTLTVLRNGNAKEVKVTLTARPKSESQPNQIESDAANHAWLGVRGLAVTPDVIQAMNLPADQQGVLVEQVEQDSPADQAGLRGSYKPVTIEGRRALVGGDIITGLDGQKITQLEDLQTLIQKRQPGQEITLALLRDGGSIQVKVTLGER